MIIRLKMVLPFIWLREKQLHHHNQLEVMLHKVLLKVLLEVQVPLGLVPELLVLIHLLLVVLVLVEIHLLD